MKGRKIILVMSSFVSMSIGAYTAVPYNQIKKMYHHISPANKNNTIELGSLVFYFSQEPQMKQLVNRRLANGLKEEVFLLPKTKVTKDIVYKINKINNGYQAKIITNRQDLKLILQYNPKKIGTAHDTFDSISLQKGLVIRFFNKELLDKIRKHPKPILQMAALHAKKKKLL